MGKTVTAFSAISVDCVNNDPVDINAGGPKYLGFDFNVRKEETEEIIGFIKETLTTLCIPLMDISARDADIEVKEDVLWNKEDILVCISDDAADLIRESQRYYNAPQKVKK